MPIKILLADLSIVSVQKKKLIEKSDVFDIMLSQNMMEAKNKLIDMSAYNPIAVIHVLRYAMYDKYPTIEEYVNEHAYKNYLETFALAHQYNMLPLTTYIAKSIAYSINNFGSVNLLFDGKHMDIACSKILLFQIRDIFIKRINDILLYGSLKFWPDRNSRLSHHLIFHGRGTGRTCASLAIAEKFKKMLQNGRHYCTTFVLPNDLHLRVHNYSYGYDINRGLRAPIDYIYITNDNNINNFRNYYL